MSRNTSRNITIGIAIAIAIALAACGALAALKWSSEAPVSAVVAAQVVETHSQNAEFPEARETVRMKGSQSTPHVSGTPAAVPADSKEGEGATTSVGIDTAALDEATHPNSSDPEMLLPRPPDAAPGEVYFSDLSAAERKNLEANYKDKPWMLEAMKHMEMNIAIVVGQDCTTCLVLLDFYAKMHAKNTGLPLSKSAFLDFFDTQKEAFASSLVLQMTDKRASAAALYYQSNVLNRPMGLEEVNSFFQSGVWIDYVEAGASDEAIKMINTAISTALESKPSKSPATATPG